MFIFVLIFSFFLVGADTNAIGGKHPAIFKNPINPDYESHDNGILTSFCFSAWNGFSEQVEKGSQAMSNVSVSEGDQAVSLVPGYSDLLDLQAAQNIKLNCYGENKGRLPAQIAFTMFLPKKQGEEGMGIAPEPQNLFSGDLRGISVAYGTKEGEITEQDRRGGREVDFTQVEEITVSGTLQPGQLFSMTLPIQIEKKPGPKGLYLPVTIRHRYPIRKEQNLGLVALDQNFSLEELTAGRVAALYRDKETGELHAYPAWVQEIMPQANSKSIEIRMFKKPEGEQWVPQRDAPRFLNEYSIYRISLSQVQETIKNQGFSLYGNRKEGLDSFHVHSFAPEPAITGEDGTPVVLGKEYQGVKLSAFYTEIYQVLKANDRWIHAGDAWNLFDNLVWAKRPVKSKGEEERIDLTRIQVEHNVDVNVPGEYRVKYSCMVVPGETVSVERRVVVLDRNVPLPEGEQKNTITIVNDPVEPGTATKSDARILLMEGEDLQGSAGGDAPGEMSLEGETEDAGEAVLEESLQESAAEMIEETEPSAPALSGAALDQERYAFPDFFITSWQQMDAGGRLWALISGGFGLLGIVLGLFRACRRGR